MMSKRVTPPPGMTNTGMSIPSSSITNNKLLLCDQYPINSTMELLLEPNDEKIQGLVYCTDELSKSIVIKQSLNYTTLASDIRIINASCVKEKKIISESPKTKSNNGIASTADTNIELLPNVNKKALLEKEKRAIKLAEESLRHINSKASPAGQAVFDRLLKACNEVAWSGESIIVLSQIKVDPPYSSDNCKLIYTGGDVNLNEGSLERVKRIVGAGG